MAHALLSAEQKRQNTLDGMNRKVPLTIENYIPGRLNGTPPGKQKGNVIGHLAISSTVLEIPVSEDRTTETALVDELSLPDLGSVQRRSSTAHGNC